MDYEKKYKDALKEARNYYEDGSVNEFLDIIFPELKENDEERNEEY